MSLISIIQLRAWHTPEGNCLLFFFLFLFIPRGLGGGIHDFMSLGGNASSFHDHGVLHGSLHIPALLGLVVINYLICSP